MHYLLRFETDTENFMKRGLPIKMSLATHPKGLLNNTRIFLGKCVKEALAFAPVAFPVKERYFLAQDAGLKLRYIATPLLAMSVIALFGQSTGIGTLNFAAAQSQGYKLIAKTSSFDRDRPADTWIQARLEKETKRLTKHDTAQKSPVYQASFIPDIASDPVADRAEEEPSAKIVEIGKGDVLSAVLSRAGVEAKAAYELISAMSEAFDPRKIRPGQTLTVAFDSTAQGKTDPTSLELSVDPVHTVSVERMDDGSYKAEMAKKPMIERENAGRAVIQTSLYGSAAKAGIPGRVTSELIRIFSWSLDFQRDIRSGDTVDVFYKTKETEDGSHVDDATIQYARLNVNGADMQVYRFKMDDGRYDYFDENGISIRKTLMKTPVDGARISSGYGRRKHPVLGYHKMHKGVDFAAPTGTPIYAAGDGVVQRANRFSSYGNYIKIRHNGSLQTAYAHLNGFAKGIRAGTRVKQGQVIGYIGSTGRSTGPHLHYEVIVNGNQVNPNSLDLPTGEQLKGPQLARFKSEAKTIDRQYMASRDNQDIKVAQR